MKIMIYVLTNPYYHLPSNFYVLHLLVEFLIRERIEYGTLMDQWTDSEPMLVLRHSDLEVVEPTLAFWKFRKDIHNFYANQPP